MLLPSTLNFYLAYVFDYRDVERWTVSGDSSPLMPSIRTDIGGPSYSSSVVILIGLVIHDLLDEFKRPLTVVDVADVDMMCALELAVFIKGSTRISSFGSEIPTESRSSWRRSFSAISGGQPAL